jgi:hypothetical protein
MLITLTVDGRCALPAFFRFLSQALTNINLSGHHEEGGSCSPSFSPLANRALVKLPPSSYDSATPGMLRPDLSASLPVDTQRPGGGRLLPLGDQICNVNTHQSINITSVAHMCH